MATHRSNWLRPRWITASLGVAIGAVIAGAVLLAPPQVEAVHNSPFPFELDGDALQNAGRDDWANVFGITTPFPKVPQLGDGETFVVDVGSAGNAESGFSGQSNKDIDAIGTWLYDKARVTPDKDNITNAYAKAYRVNHDNNSTTDEHLVIYFGADRLANEGTAALGFWFFQNAVGLVPIVPPAKSARFSGEHAVGDILVQVDFQEAANKPDKIQIFEWVGSGGSHGSLHELAFASANNVTAICTTGDTACATVSVLPAKASPWAFDPKNDPANTFQDQSFFEGGIDITALIGDVCFSSFMAETRTSATETSELKDFALGDFDLCSVDVEKVCVNDNGVTSPVVDPFNNINPFQTRHTVTITNDGFGGKLYDVELRDDTVTATSVCSIVAISGGGTGFPTIPTAGIPLPINTFVEVANELSGAVAVTLICNTNDNPFRNGVSVRSKPTPSGASDVTDNDLESQTEADVCGITLDTGLVLKKWCQGNPGSSLIPPGVNPYYVNGDLSVVLDSANQFKPKVCVDIELSSSTSNQKMVFVNGGTAAPCNGNVNSGDYFCDSDLGNLLPTGGLTLNPNTVLDGSDKFVVHQCYSPTAPDGNQTNPGLVTYSDTVQASGRGKLDGARATATPQTATCKLCPECPDCD